MSSIEFRSVVPRLIIAASAMLVAAACSPPVTLTDAQTDGTADTDETARSDAQNDTAATACRTDTDCSDGLFCTGNESCRPGGTGADARGCVAGTAPCGATMMCVEASDQCVPMCADADGDGHAALACGGDDCDDANPLRHPGATETCDVANVDEDCNPATFGALDADGDGHTAAQCCNQAAGGALNCGDDCDDSSPDVHPGSAEVCDGRDNNCNGTIDEGVARAFYVDMDGDGFGDPTGTTMTACIPPAGYVENATDCDDTASAVHPGAVEVCDAAMVDENCDGVANPPSLCACTVGAARPCAAPGACAAGTESCVSGAWSACSIGPVPETCNGVDDNCNGLIDEGLTVTCYTDNDNDTYAPAGGTSSLHCPVAGRDSVGGCPAGFTNRAPTSAASTDCNDTNATIHPGAGCP